MRARIIVKADVIFKSELFVVHYRKDHHNALIRWPWQNGQPILKYLKDKADEKLPNQGLWWKSMTPTHVHQFPVVRNHIQRRAKYAFTNVLRARGYNQQGMWIGRPDSDGSRETIMTRPAETSEPHPNDLKGTLKLSPTVETLNKRLAELEEALSPAFESLLKAQPGSALPRKQHPSSTKPRTAKRNVAHF